MKAKSSLVLPVAFLAAFVLLTPGEAQAQYYGGGGYRPAPSYGPTGHSRWGFRHRVHGYVGGQLTGFAVLAQVTDYDVGYLSHGGGGGLFGGVRLGPWLSLELNWGVTFHDESFEARGAQVTALDSLYLMTITADVKIHIPTRGPVEPFIQGGIGFAYIGATYGDVGCAGCDTIFAKGPAFDLGGGIEVWLGPWISLGGRLLYRGLYFTEDAYGRRASNASSNFVNGISLDGFATFHF